MESEDKAAVRHTLKKFSFALTDPNLFGTLSLKHEFCEVHQKMKKAYLTEDEEGKKMHLCDLCLLMAENKKKNVTPLARLALDLVQQYQDVFG